jgi:hypothetical protein
MLPFCFTIIYVVILKVGDKMQVAEKERLEAVAKGEHPKEQGAVSKVLLGVILGVHNWMVRINPSKYVISERELKMVEHIDNLELQVDYLCNLIRRKEFAITELHLGVPLSGDTVAELEGLGLQEEDGMRFRMLKQNDGEDFYDEDDQKLKAAQLMQQTMVRQQTSDVKQLAKQQAAGVQARFKKQQEQMQAEFELERAATQSALELKQAKMSALGKNLEAHQAQLTKMASDKQALLDKHNLEMLRLEELTAKEKEEIDESYRREITEMDLLHAQEIEDMEETFEHEKEEYMQEYNRQLGKVINKMLTQMDKIWDACDLPGERAAFRNANEVVALISWKGYDIVQKRLNDLRVKKDVVRMIRNREAFIKKIEEFETQASEKKRLFGSSLRLVDEEKFRKTCYPTLREEDKRVILAIEHYQKKFKQDFIYPDGVNALETVQLEIASRPVNIEATGLLGLMNNDTTGPRGRARKAAEAANNAAAAQSEPNATGEQAKKQKKKKKKKKKPKKVSDNDNVGLESKSQEDSHAESESD